jgi:hypothetical protein
MRVVALLLCLGMTATEASAAPVTAVVFQPGAEPVLTFGSPNAIVYDGTGTKQFVATREYLLGLAGPDPRIRAWNPSRSLVRISPRGAPELWIGCEAVKPAGMACIDLQLTIGLDNDLRVARKPTARAGASRGAKGPVQESARGLPQCPGDPRCPR